MKLKKTPLLTCVTLIVIFSLYLNVATAAPGKDQTKRSLIFSIVVNSCYSLKVENLANKILISATIET